MMATRVIEVREEEDVKRLEKIAGDMLNRWGVKADVTMVIAQKTN